MSPRRSSRARTSQPSPLVPTQTTSSNSSVSSERAQRATRSLVKPGSPRRSVPRSQSRDDPEEPSKPPPRRTRSGHIEIKTNTLSVDLNGDADEDDAQEEDEITRCVCGLTEYPGLSTPFVEMLKRVAYSPPEEQTYEQLGDIFLCCDICHVWQHAGCVGILGKINEPDSYFCDECRRDLHKISTSLEGQRYSCYAPIMDEPPYRKSPKPSTRNGKAKERPRSNTDTTIHKRRVTLNSRNEDEELARAIEESKRDDITSPSTAASRSVKRARDDDDDSKDTSIKRQRTDSPTPTRELKEEQSDGEAAADALIDATPRNMLRGPAARNNGAGAKDAREQKDRDRQAAASARKVRSERRRGEDSDAEEPVNDNLPSTAASTPPPEPTPVSTRIGHKKKPTPSRRGRAGRSQHARDRDSPILETGDEAAGLLATNPHNTRARSRSRSVVRDEESRDRRGGFGTPNGTNNEPRSINGPAARGTAAHDDGGLLAKPSKAKNFNEKKTSLNEMKKRVAAILEFVHRAQNERTGGEGTSSAGMSRTGSEVDGSQNVNGSLMTNGGPSRPVGSPAPTEDKNSGPDQSHDKPITKEEFDRLSAAEMLVSLRTRLVAFEGNFGRWGDGR